MNDTFRYRILSRRIAKVAFLSSIAKFLNRRKFFALNSIKAKLSLTPADDPTGDYFPSNDVHLLSLLLLLLLLMFIVDGVLEILRGFFFQDVFFLCMSRCRNNRENRMVGTTVCTVKKVKQTLLI